MKLYTLTEFAKVERIRHSTLVAYMRRGDGPETTPAGKMRIITEQQRQDWRARMARERSGEPEAA